MKIAWMIVAAALAVPAMAQLKLDALNGLAAKAKESTEITLDAATLQMANGFLGDGKDKNPAVAKMLGKLKSLSVRSYEFSKAGQYDPGIVRALQSQLAAQGWTRFLNFNDQEDGESFEMYSKTVDGKSAGFAMVAAEAKELTVIYIDGELSLSDLSGLSGQFGIPKIPIPNGQNDKKGKE